MHQTKAMELASTLPRRLLLARRGFVAAAAGLAAMPWTAGPARAAGRIDARLQELGVTLPKVSPPVANYVPYVVSGNFAYIAGQLAFQDGELMHPGQVPTDVSVEDAQAAARQCAINLIASLQAACDGDLDRVQRCVQLQGFVASADDFHEQSQVVNGASDFMVEVFGDAGRHARMAVGTNALPLDASVEVAGVFAIS